MRFQSPNSVCAGESAELKNGDLLLFGSDSQMKVHITPASDESTTVEQHLRAECEMLMQRVQVSTPAHVLLIEPCTGLAKQPGRSKKRRLEEAQCACMYPGTCSDTTVSADGVPCIQSASDCTDLKVAVSQKSSWSDWPHVS